MYESLFQALSNGSLNFIDMAVLKVTGVLSTTVGVMGTLYFIWIGYEIWAGKINQPLSIFINRAFKFLVILGILTTSEFYLDVIVKSVWDTPDFIANLVTGTESSGGEVNSKFLDKFRDDIFILTERLNDTGGWRNPKPILTAFAIEIVTLLITAYAFFLFALSKVMIALLLSVGCFFIIMYMFESTQKFFEAWFNQIMNFIILYLLVSAVLLLLEGILKSTLTSALATNDIGLSDIIQPVVFLVVSAFILIQLTGISSALGGGVALNTGQLLSLAPYRWLQRQIPRIERRPKSPEQKRAEKRRRRIERIRKQSRRNNITRKR